MSISNKNTPQNQLNKVQSQQALQIKSLSHELLNLKTQLKRIKVDQRATQITQVSTNSNGQNGQRNNTELISIEEMSKEYEVRMDFYNNQLRKALSKHPDKSKIKQCINQVYHLLNLQLKDLKSKGCELKDQFQEMLRNIELQYKEDLEKNKQIQKENKDLSEQVQELKEKLELIQKNDEKGLNKELLQKLQILQLQNYELFTNNNDLENILQKWQLNCRSLQQKCNSYEKNIEVKTQAMIFLEQDIKYLRIQSQKFKVQKKEIQKLWEKSTLENKELRRSYEGQLEKLQKEKNKWMNECSLRRHQSEQIHAIENHKDLLFKEIQELRSSYSLKCKELTENKTLLYDNQRKLINLQSENYKLNQQILSMKTKTSFWEGQMSNLRSEVKEIQEVSEKTMLEQKISKKNLLVDSDKKKNRDEKLKALEDIHSLIRQHKLQIEQEQ